MTHKLSDTVQHPLIAPVQPKLEIGEADDEYEKEANAVADKVMCMTDGADDNGKIMHGEDGEEKKVMRMADEEENIMCMTDEEEHLQEEGHGGATVSADMEKELADNKGRGGDLPEALQREMGSKIGADFSGVKIHTDANAVQMNREIGAKAFAHSNNIYFNSGQYNPATQQGKHLLAHELAHTVQQGAVNRVSRKTPDDDEGKDPIDKYIAYLEKEGKIEGQAGSKDKAKEVIVRSQNKTYTPSVKVKALLVNELMNGGLAGGDGKYVYAIMYDDFDTLVTNKDYGIDVIALYDQTEYTSNNVIATRISSLLGPNFGTEDIVATAEEIRNALEKEKYNKNQVYLSLERFSGNQQALERLKKEYETKYAVTLEKDVTDKMPESERSLALNLLGVNIDENRKLNTAPAPESIKLTSGELYSAIEAGNSAAVSSLLMPFHLALRSSGKRDVTDSLINDYQANTGSKVGLVEHIKTKLAGDDALFALYLIQSPGAYNFTGEPNAQLTKVLDVKSTEVAGGKSFLLMGADFKTSARSAEGGFGMNYTGALSQETRWLQFLWREVVAIDKNNKETRIGGNVSSSSGDYQLTTDDAKKVYNLDTIRRSEAPWYEAPNKDNELGPGTRMAGVAAIYDLPDWLQTYDAVVKAFELPDTVKVESRATFTSYLIRGFTPLHSESIRMFYFGEKATDFNEKTKAADLPYYGQVQVDPESKDHLMPGMKEALNARFPGQYDYIK